MRGIRLPLDSTNRRRAFRDAHIQRPAPPSTRLVSLAVDQFQAGNQPPAGVRNSSSHDFLASVMTLSGAPAATAARALTFSAASIPRPNFALSSSSSSGLATWSRSKWRSSLSVRNGGSPFSRLGPSRSSRAHSRRNASKPTMRQQDSNYPRIFNSGGGNNTPSPRSSSVLALTLSTSTRVGSKI